MVLVFSLTGVGQAYGNEPPTVTLKTPGRSLVHMDLVRETSRICFPS